MKGLSKPASRIKDIPGIRKPYRDDPESSSPSFGVSLRPTAENSPVMEFEFEMHPIVNSSHRKTLPVRTNTGKRCDVKLLWIVFVLMVGAYAISRYKHPIGKVQQQQQQAASNNQVANASTSALCGRKLPFDLFDTSTWPTPYTPSYFRDEPTNSSYTALLITYANSEITIRSINELFSAFDMAYEQNSQLYITKTASWIWDAIIPPFFGERVERDDTFWQQMQDALDVTILNTEEEAKAFGKELKIFDVKMLLYTANTLTPEQIRNRRDTIFRKLLRITPHTPKGDSCFTIGLCGLTNTDSYHSASSYIVIDLSPSASKAYQLKFDDISGRDHSGAYQMTPSYVKSILKPMKLHTETIFMMGNHSITEDEEIKRLMDDPELRTKQAVEESDDYDHSDMLHLAVLADVYLADPTSQWSLMIARMRYALGLTNTFVLTESKIDENGEEVWVSYVSKDYLELYDRTHLGPWMG
jgi:hypothetical protein